MLQILKKTLRHSVIYGLGKLSGRLVGLILLPLYTKNISVADYGAYALIELFIQLMAITFTFGINSAMFRWMNINTDPKYRGSLIFTSLTIIAFISIALFSVGTLFRSNISFYLLGDITYINLIDYVFLIISIELIRNILFNIVRIYERSTLFSVVSVLSLTLNLTLNIYFIAFLNMGLKGILIASAASGGFTACFLLLFFIKEMHFSFNITSLKAMIKFGFPIIFSSIFGLVINMSDRYIIKLFLTLEDVGKYAFVYKIAATVNVFLIQSFLLAWPAIAWENIKKPNPEEFISKMATYFTFIAVWFALALSVTSKPLIFWISNNADYNEGYYLVPLIAVSFVFSGLYYILGFPLHFKKKTKHFIQISGFSAGLNLIINFSLVPYFGINVAAVTTLFSFVLMSILSYYYSKRYFNIRIELNRIFRILIVGLSLYFTAYFLTIYRADLALISAALSIILFPVILYKTSFFNLAESKSIKAFLKKFNPLI